MPRVALLALTVLVMMVSISQRSSPNGRVTIALSWLFFVGALLLLVALPAAFFRAKIQEAKERNKSRKVRMQRSRNRKIVRALLTAASVVLPPPKPNKSGIEKTG